MDVVVFVAVNVIVDVDGFLLLSSLVRFFKISYK